MTLHGLGTVPSGVSDAARRFWLPAAIFERTLELTPQVEANTGVDICFTFDDGNLSDRTIGLPLLQAHGRKATFFVCAGRIGKPGFLGPAELRELVDAGMTIGSHGYDHRNWREASDAELAHELKDSKEMIEAVVGRTVDVASAPFGALDHRVVNAAAATGFHSLFASSGGFATASSGLIPRNTLKSCFNPDRDLERMTRRSQRAWDGLYDTVRRVKYRFF